MKLVRSRDDARVLDAEDEIAHCRGRYLLPDDVIYLNGNSLGPLPSATPERLRAVLHDEWASQLGRSWETRGWLELSDRVAAAIAPLVGAAADELVVGDSTSLNLFKLLAAALRLRPERRVILAEKESFPTDLYVAQGLADLVGGGVSLRLVDRAALSEALTPDVAVLSLSHVDFRTGAMHDLAVRTGEAHEAGAVVVWDLAHSAGAVPVELDSSGADLAVGCGYKYLNGGPGAPAFAYVARRHHSGLRAALWGWMGHVRPFDFAPTYEPAPGVSRLKVGTPPILGLAALECGVASLADIGIDRLRAKSVALGECFIDLVERECSGRGVGLASPRDPARRGSHVALTHPDAASIVRRLGAAGVVADYRPLDLLRFGLAPAYLRFVDVWDAVAALRAAADG